MGKCRVHEKRKAWMKKHTAGYQDGQLKPGIDIIQLNLFFFYIFWGKTAVNVAPHSILSCSRGVLSEIAFSRKHDREVLFARRFIYFYFHIYIYSYSIRGMGPWD